MSAHLLQSSSFVVFVRSFFIEFPTVFFNLSKMIAFNVFTLIILLSFLQFAVGEDLLELGCLEDQQCKQFERSNIKGSCMDGRCVCVDQGISNGTHVKCEPQDMKVSNIIGGHCPCHMPDAVCKEPENICYCASGFVGSGDKRRCIPAKVPMTGICETDKQCHDADIYAICDVKEKFCNCATNFTLKDGKCVSIVAPAATCHNDSDCSVFGENIACFMDTQQCVCHEGFVKARNETVCLPSVAYQENCTENQQCWKKLGLGGACLNGTCECGDQHYVLEYENNTINNLVETNVRCIRVIEIGEYCTKDEDCHKRRLPKEQQTMNCHFGECNCMYGFHSTNETECVKSKGNIKRAQQTFGLALVLIIWALKMQFGR